MELLAQKEIKVVLMACNTILVKVLGASGVWAEFKLCGQEAHDFVKELRDFEIVE